MRGSVVSVSSMSVSGEPLSTSSVAMAGTMACRLLLYFLSFLHRFYFLFIFVFIVYYSILVYFYNAHQALVGLPQGVGGLDVPFILV
jgi:hypothetical protein